MKWIIAIIFVFVGIFDYLLCRFSSKISRKEENIEFERKIEELNK